MRILMLEQGTVAGELYQAGELYEVPGWVAAQLLGRGLAVVVRCRPEVAIRPPSERAITHD